MTTTGDKIQLLSEGLCNLVRAQEVVSNPAAAVKELLDNAIDAGATHISLDTKEGGKEYIHVTDNGCGMSPIDARMAFERHATSKLRTAEDLERIQTLGFRGEGLASIATIANVVLRTRRAEDELATEVLMTGGRFAGQSTVVAPLGTSIRMNEVFFNVPGRRRSLKKTDTEERAIDTEFTQCVLAHPDIHFTYYKGGSLSRDLPKASLKERIIAVAGRSINQKLLPINYESSIISITGFISHPEDAVQRLHKQFFFVNGRYIKHDYFRKAVELAFEGLIPQNSHPHYFIYFTVPPENVDINIHPSKKEVRFVDEPFIFQLLKQLTREALSAHAAMPMIDWDNPTSIDIPAYGGRKDLVEEQATQPKEEGLSRRVFFGGGSLSQSKGGSSLSFGSKTSNSYDIDWNNLAESFEQNTPPTVQEQMFPEGSTAIVEPLSMPHGVFQGTDYPTIGLLIYKGRYIVSSLRRGLALIDFRKAHLRVLYEQYLRDFSAGHIEMQELMFPEQIDFSLDEQVYTEQLLDLLPKYGFVLSPDGGEHSYKVEQAPTLVASQVVGLLHELLQACIDACDCSEQALLEHLALSCAEQTAYSYGSKLEPQQVDDLLAQLFASSNPNYDPKGGLIISLIGEEEIEARFR